MPPSPLELLKTPSNRICADCGAREPRWASVSIGIFICEICSGIHRSLGTHISKVRSVKLDTWRPEWVERCRLVGNARAAAYYEHSVAPGAAFRGQTDLAGGDKIDPASAEQLRSWIRAKYEEKRYAPAGVEEPWRRLERGDSLEEAQLDATAHVVGAVLPQDAANAQRRQRSKRRHQKKKTPAGADMGGWPTSAGNAGENVAPSWSSTYTPKANTVPDAFGVDCGCPFGNSGAFDNRAMFSTGTFHNDGTHVNANGSCGFVDAYAFGVGGNMDGFTDQTAVTKGRFHDGLSGNCEFGQWGQARVDSWGSVANSAGFATGLVPENGFTTSPGLSRRGGFGGGHGFGEFGGFGDTCSAPVCDDGSSDWAGFGARIKTDAETGSRAEAESGSGKVKRSTPRARIKAEPGPEALPSSALDASTNNGWSKSSASRPPPPLTPAGGSSAGGNYTPTSAQFDHYRALFRRLDGQGMGSLGANEAKDLFESSGLPVADLSRIWTSSDLDGDGRLAESEFLCAMALAAARRQGAALQNTPPPELLEACAGGPSLVAIGAHDSQGGPRGAGAETTAAAAAQGQTDFGPTSQETSMWALLPGEMERFKAIFDHLGEEPGVGSRNGVASAISRSKAQEVLDTSGLQTSQVAAAWALLPPLAQGQWLHFGAFACLLVFAARQRRGVQLPASLPDELATLLPMGAPAAEPGNAGIANPAQSHSWEVSKDELKKYSALFENLTRGCSGNFLDADEAVDFLLGSGLSQEDLARIWELADADRDGRLSLPEFIWAVALTAKRRQGAQLPQELPQKLLDAAATLACDGAGG